MIVIVQIDFKLVTSYNFAKKYGWEIDEVRSVHEVMFKDGISLNQINNQSLSNEDQLQVYLINDPREMSAIICSEALGFAYDQIIDRKIKLYSLAVKHDIKFSHDGILFTPDIELKIGFLDDKIVFGTLFILSQTGSGYYPVNFNEDSIKEEILKVYDNRPYYVSIYGDVRISFLPGGYQLFHYPYNTSVIFPQVEISPETLDPIIPAEIVKVGFDNRYIIALQNEYTTGEKNKFLDIPLDKYYILDTENETVYSYDTLENFENQRRQLKIDNIEFQDINSFSVMSYDRFANKEL